jgi:hypothetical protein
MQERLPEGRKMKHVMIDKSPTEMRALRDCDIIFFLCFFHVLQAWERFVRSADSGVTSKATRKHILKDIIALVQAKDAQVFALTQTGFEQR